ncbi:MAG: hypothetical protein M3O26_03030 [Pseudomonadota bacterium]|nr:hypothetical protein [Pseudomonadota bacterium]
MKNLVMSLVFAAGAVLGAQAIADDSSKAANSGDKTQMMKECMERQKATNSSMTHAAMETVCKNEMKGNGTKDGNDLATGPKANTDK